MCLSWLSSITFFNFYVVIGTVAAILAYIWGTWNYDYFAKRNIPFLKPVPFFGNSFRSVIQSQSVTDFVKETYDKLSHCKVVGIFQFRTPMFFINDPELLKAIFVKDFDHFMDHQNVIPEGAEPLFEANLFTLKGHKWKYMRNLLTPAFTSSKMKGMFHLITQCGQQLVDYLETRFKESGCESLSVDTKDLFTRFTNDVIATSAFGISCDSLKNPDNEFYKCGMDISNFGGIRSLIFIAYIIFPKLMKMLNMGFFSNYSRDFLYKTVRETIEIREKNGIIRPDMIHLLMQARKGELKDDGDENNAANKEKTKIKPQKFELTDTDITAQATIFFLAGFDTASLLLGFASILLAENGDIQERLQREIDETLENCRGNITYDALHNMKYLDMVVSETLRMYPPLPATDRVCVKPYVIQATEKSPEVKISAKQLLFIPVYGIHHDPQYFPDPEKFDPERFSDENKHNIKPFTYMPFGLGPRSCIGNRFALMEGKIALTYLLSRFSLHITDKSPVPMKFSANSFTIKPEKGFWLGLKRREKY